MAATQEQDEPVDIVILTVIPIELDAARRVLRIDSGHRKKDRDGTIYYRGVVRSERTRRSYTVALICIGGPGNPAAAAATAKAIAKYHPRTVVLMGIAAGIRDKVKIGEVVLSERVVAYEPAALIESDSGVEAQPRPEIERAPHTILQDLASYGRPDPPRLDDAFRRAGGAIPSAPVGREAEFNAHVASGIDAHQGTIASGEKLLRNPERLRQLRELHGKVEAAEMEAAGVVDGCRPGAVPWLIIRGISDFGDGRKDDGFHAFASCAAAAVLYDFIAHGLDLGISPPPAAVNHDSIAPPSVDLHPNGSASVPQRSRRPALFTPNQRTGTTLRVLHISDLHGRSLHGPQSERARLEARRRDKVLGEAWARNLEEIQEDGVPFDLIVFTGDLGDWGDASDYDDGVAFLRDTCKRLRVSPDRLFLVPGNHDVNRRHAPESWKLMRDLSEENPEAVSRWLAGGAAPRGVSDATRDAVLERTLAFWKAVEHDLDRAELLPTRSAHKRLGYRVRLDLPVSVHIIGFDSAWLAGDGADAGRLLITEDQVNLLASDDHGKPLDGFRLALVHHPLSDLHSADTAKGEIADRVDLLLRGHQHAAISRTLVDPDRRLHELAAGCLYEGARGNHHPNGCQVIDVDLGGTGIASAIHVRFRSWSPHGHWHDDSSLYRAARQGRLTIPLTEAPDPDRPDQAASNTSTSDQKHGDDAPPNRAVVGFKSLFGPSGVRPESATSLPLFPALVEGIERRLSFRIREFLNEYTEAPFGGRDAEQKELDEWLGDETPRLGMIVAGAGHGKSALLVKWSQHVAETGRADVVFMPISLRFETARASDAARAIAKRLVHLLPPDRNAVPPDDPSEVLQECKEMFRTPWSGARPLLVVIDGLDETIDWRCEQLIPPVAGNNVKLLVAARRISTGHTDWEDKLRWTNCRQFSLRSLTAVSVAEIVNSASEFRAVAEDKSLMARFHALTEGDPLIVHLQLNLLRQGKQGSPLERMERLLRESSLAGDPLQRFFDRWWREQQEQWGPPSEAENIRIRAVFDLLACAKGPLGLADLRALTRADPETLRQTLEQLGRFVIVDRTADRYVFSHSRLQEYFDQKLLEAGDGPRWRQRLVEHGDACFTELEVASTIQRRDEFERRFGYVIRHYALHLKETAPENLPKLASRPWLEGWRALDGEDGVYGGFHDDMSRVEAHAREARLIGEHARALLVKASIASLSSNVPPWLIRQLVEAKLWPLSRALRLIERLVDENEKASALGVLAGAVKDVEQPEVLKRAMALPRYRSKAMAWMISDLAEPLKVLALEELLVEGTILQPYSLLNLKNVFENLPLALVSKVLDIVPSLPDPNQRAYILLAVAKWAQVLSPEERLTVFKDCRASTLAVDDTSRRIHYLCEMATATECAPTIRELLLQSVWDVVRTLKPDRKGDTAAEGLVTLLDHLDVMTSATQREITDAIWDLIEGPEWGWTALLRFGPGLARHGVTSRVMDRIQAIIRDEHTRCMLLGSLLQHGGDLTGQIADCLKQSKPRNWALGQLVAGFDFLPSTQRAECLAEVFDLVNRSPHHAYLIETIASRLRPGDPDAPRLLAAARGLKDPAERSGPLAACATLVSDEERGLLVEEILRDAGAITDRDSKKRLLARLMSAIQTNDKLLRSALAVARQIGDAGLLADAVERVAAVLAEAGHADEAGDLAEGAVATFTQHPQWGVETYVRVSRSLSPSSASDVLWNRAAQVADELPAGVGRAALLASLARPAPTQLKQQHLLIVGEAIDALADSFQKTYARIRLLDGLEPDTRQSTLALVVANLTEGMSRHENLTLIRKLLTRLSRTERELYGATLDAIITGLLRRRTQPVGSAQESTGDPELRDEDIRVAQLAPFLDMDSVRDAIARTPAEFVSDLAALAMRMANLGHHTTALEAVRKIESPDARSRSLAGLLEHLPSAMHFEIIEEARRDLAIQGDRGRSAETESLIVPYLRESEREACIRTALIDVCSMKSDKQRRETMRRLAESAVHWLSSQDLEDACVAILERIAKQRRQELVIDLVSLAPMVLQIGGPQSIRAIGETFLDIAEWFP